KKTHWIPSSPQQWPQLLQLHGFDFLRAGGWRSSAVDNGAVEADPGQVAAAAAECQACVGGSFGVAQALSCNPESLPEVGRITGATAAPALSGRSRTLGIGVRCSLRINRMKNDDLHGRSSLAAGSSASRSGGKRIGYFPRGECFLVELDGCVTIPGLLLLLLLLPRRWRRDGGGGGGERQATAATQSSPTEPPAGGAATVLTNNRVIATLTRLYAGVIPNANPCGEELTTPPRAQAPPSVVISRTSRKSDVDGYCRKFDMSTIPLDGPLGEHVGFANLERARAARDGLRAIADGGGAAGATRGPTSAGALLSSYASEKDPSVLVNNFAKSVAASFGIGRGGGGGGGGGVEGIGDGGRKRPTARVGARRTDCSSGGGSSAGAGGGAKGRGAYDAEAVKAAMEDARRAASDPYLSYSLAVRHGCTKDVRDMYLETLSLIPASDVDLHRVLLEHKLIDPGESMARQRMKRKNNVDNDGKPKKRRYYERKNMRRTNTHLDGTEIGAMLAMAAEKQARGNSVGDGGM
ncbi:hypothetical protein ACHAXA_007042, partial [Cyclostephanos tholiformis]